MSYLHQTFRGEINKISKTAYCFVSTKFSITQNVTLNVLSPNDWIIVVQLKKLCNIFGPSFNSIKSLLAEYRRQILLDGNDGGGGKVVTQDPK